MSYPHTTDPLVAALQRLLAAQGGHIAVGRAAGINDQSLYQIAFRKHNKSTGKPKSVGPSIRKRLDAAYPGWLDPPAPLVAREPAPPPLELALRVVLARVSTLTPRQWEMVAARMAGTVGDPADIGAACADVLAVLRAATSERPTPAAA